MPAEKAGGYPGRRARHRPLADRLPTVIILQRQFLPRSPPCNAIGAPLGAGGRPPSILRSLPVRAETCQRNAACPKTFLPCFPGGTLIPIGSRCGSSRAMTAATRSNCVWIWACCKWSSMVLVPTAREGERLRLVARILPAATACPRRRESRRRAPFSTGRRGLHPAGAGGEGSPILPPLCQFLAFWSSYELCARDTSRNLRLFAFVREHARQKKDKMSFDQWRPYVTMMHTRAVATPLVEMRDYERRRWGSSMPAWKKIHRFLEEYHPRRQCRVVQRIDPSHAAGREQVVARRPGRLPAVKPQSPLVRLREALEKAIREERFEDAARLRDQIRGQDEPPMRPGPSDGLCKTLPQRTTVGIRIRNAQHASTSPTLTLHSFLVR